MIAILNNFRCYIVIIIATIFIETNLLHTLLENIIFAIRRANRFYEKVQKESLGVLSVFQLKCSCFIYKVLLKISNI